MIGHESIPPQPNPAESSDRVALGAEFDNHLPDPETRRTDIDPVVAGVAGATAVGADVDKGSRNGNGADEGLVRRRGRRWPRNSSEAEVPASKTDEEPPVPTPNSNTPPPPARPDTGPVEKSSGDGLVGRVRGRRNRRGKNADNNPEADAPVADNSGEPAEPGRGSDSPDDGLVRRRGQRWHQHPTTTTAAPDDESVPRSGWWHERRERRAQKRRDRDQEDSTTPDDLFYDNDLYDDDYEPLQSAPPDVFNDGRTFEAPPVQEKPRSLLTPAGIASWVGFHTTVASIAIKDRLQLEQNNPKAMKWINIGTVALVGARMAFGVYAAGKGLGSGGQPNAEAMQIVTDTIQSESGSQTGTFTEGAIDATAMHVEPVALELPFNDSTEATLPPVDPGDIAPAATSLGAWGGEANPSQGTMWGETMDYLQDMGHDTNALSLEEKTEIVDDVLTHHGLTWDQAAQLQADHQVQMPSANAMEGIMDEHQIIHGELEPTVETPEEQPDAPDTGGNTGEDGSNGDEDEGSTGSNESEDEQTSTTPTPETTTPPPTTEEPTTTTPPPTSTEEPTTTTTPAPASSSPQPEEAAETSTANGWRAARDEALTATWQSALIYAGASTVAGIGLGIKEDAAAPPRPRRRAPRRPGRGPGSSRP